MGEKKKKQEKEKPLEKMTAKELREIAKQIPDVTGVHGMNKSELISAVKKARGIEEPPKQTASLVRDLKKKIKELKAESAAIEEPEKAKAHRRHIINLKKKSRRLAKAA